MGDPGAWSSAGGLLAGSAVVVPVDVEAAAPAAPAAARARAAWARMSARVTWRLQAPVAAWTNRRLSLSERLVLALAAALFLMGCATSVLANFAIILPPLAEKAKACVPPTDAHKVATSLRTASEQLLLSSWTQMLAAASLGLLVLASSGPPVTVIGTALMGVSTSFHASDVLELLLVTCHGEFAFHMWLVWVGLWVTSIVAGGGFVFLLR